MRKVFMQIGCFYGLLVWWFGSCTPADLQHFDVIILGGGTGGTAAAIQASRQGVNTLLVEPTPWLGGMLTSAGVSAIDGNHQLPSGLWGEFRDSLYRHYGDPQALATGWVSNTQFEPAVGARIWANMADRIPQLTVLTNHTWGIVEFKNGGWTVQLITPEGSKTATSRILIDGTDLGDVAKSAGVTYDLGMEARGQTGEDIAPVQANDIIQDFTYVAILKGYDSTRADHLLPSPPPGYQRELYLCSCKMFCDSARHACETMLSYAKLPGNKYMINWPLHGNDFYSNMVDLKPAGRDSVYALAKNRTLGFIYFIQRELGWKHLGLADDEFDTPDRLPYGPYHREGRRIHGLVRFNLNHIQKPFDYSLYRTGVGSGDYPVDHHHKQNSMAPDLEFYPVPSFNLPAGCLIPQKVPQLIIADKAISVSNIINGSTRLQPVILQVGQAAGMLAALCCKKQITPGQFPIREWQDSLIQAGVYIMPYLDVNRYHRHFGSIQRVGATGILKGHPLPFKWANQTWFYPDSLLLESIFLQGLKEFGFPIPTRVEKSEFLTGETLVQLLAGIDKNLIWDPQTFWSQHFNNVWSQDLLITRLEACVVLDLLLDVFHKKDVDWDGNFE